MFFGDQRPSRLQVCRVYGDLAIGGLLVLIALTMHAGYAVPKCVVHRESLRGARPDDGSPAGTYLLIC
jgi:hypothetical protein